MLDGRLIVSRRRPDTRLTTLSLAKSTITQQPVLRWADLRRYVLIKLCKPASSIGAPRAIGVDQKSKLQKASLDNPSVPSGQVASDLDLPISRVHMQHQSSTN
jgi:hypothetical protein